MTTPGVIRGTVVIFGVWSNPIRDGNLTIRERVTSNAFDRALRNNDVAALWQHKETAPLARTRDGGLRLWADEAALRFEMRVDSSINWVNDAVVCVQSGLSNAVSFGFGSADGRTVYNSEARIWERTLHSIDLLEISLVTWSAYPGTFADFRLLDSAAQRRRQVAAFNRKMLDYKIRQTQAAVDLYEAYRRYSGNSHI
jgi:HK97 family phage prohead protease